MRYTYGTLEYMASAKRAISSASEKLWADVELGLVTESKAASISAKLWEAKHLISAAGDILAGTRIPEGNQVPNGETRPNQDS